MWGKSGVMESLTVLLEWMEADPVDTWEMGRNDSVQSITGTRNIFVDYPEYAWLLFGKEIPSNMVTPSGKAVSENHNWVQTDVKEPTCTNSGVRTYTCTDCGKTKTETINASGHKWSSWIVDTEATETTTGSKHRTCSVCDKTETVTIPVIGHTHTYTTEVTEPTCAERGYTTHICACGYSYVDSYVDTVPHKYQNGTCINCFAKDPTAPEYTVSDFSKTVTQISLGELKGESLYAKICEAIAIYNSLSDENKKKCELMYNDLISIISEYNAEIEAVNEDSNALTNLYANLSTLALSVIPFAAYSLLKKKDA
jgi:hypothetical protein